MEGLLKLLIVLISIIAHPLLCDGQNVPEISTRVTATEIVSPIVQCPHGFVAFENQCIRSIVKTETANVVLQCPPGYSLTTSGLCNKSVVHCPAGFSGPQCAPNYQRLHCSADKACPTGYHFDGVSCFLPPTTPIYAIPSCPPGFNLQSGQCVRRGATEIKMAPPIGSPQCPRGYTPAGSKCHREIVAPNGKMNALQPGSDILIEIERNQTIHILNEINVPINITNVNNHTTYVDVGQLKREHDALERTTNKTEKCCEVVSPRMCKKRPNNDWYCFHRRTEQCGKICTAPVIYLKPSRPVDASGRLVIPPRQTQYAQPPPPLIAALRSHDCSQCCQGGFCPSYCSSYDCESTNTCEYVNQTDYCSEIGGRACTEDFGCTDEGYCA